MAGGRTAGATPRIAVLEDDASQARLVENWIASQGYACRLFHRGEDILKAVLRDTYDLVILDWRVPDLSGEEVLRAMRASARDHVPVLFTTAQNREEDIVHALRAGADDYLAKPLRRLEFLARVEALLRRTPGRARDAERPLEAGAFVLDPSGRTLLKDGLPLELTQKEFEMAALLFRNIGRLLSRAYLLDTVWGIDADVGTRTVDTHASQLRSKLGLYPESGWRLSAVYQHGYRLEQLSATTVTAAQKTSAPGKGARSKGKRREA
jgi:two-component system, OmpR family, response regulator RegX3